MAPYVSPKLPVTDLIVLRAKGADVDTVLINGDVVVENGKYLRADLEELGRKIAEWRETGSTVDKNYNELLKRVASFYKRWGLKERRYRYNNFA